MDFIVDTVGDEDLQVKTDLNQNGKFLDQDVKIDSIMQLFESKKKQLDDEYRKDEDVEKKLSCLKIDDLFDQFYNEMGWIEKGPMVIKKENKRNVLLFDQVDSETGKLNSKLSTVDVDKEMEKSVLQPGIEKEHCLPPYDKTKRKLREERKKERMKTKGPEWFNLPAPELTEELKNDLQVLKMRSVLDPKHFYKKNDMEVLPKYFQVGRIMDSSLDHVNERLTKKQRKRTMVDELLADAEFQKHSKKKYKEIIEEKRKSEYKTFMREKRQKKKTELKKSKNKLKKSKS